MPGDATQGSPSDPSYLSTEADKKQREWYRFIMRLLREPGAFTGIIMLALLVTGAVLAPYLTPYEYDQQITGAVLQPPFWSPGGSTEHLLGTDSLGRDLLTRVLYGARVSLIVGVMAVVIQGVVGSVLGLVAGYFGGPIDSLIMRLLDIQFSIPFLVLAMGILMVLGSGFTKVIIVLGLTGWIMYARIVRGQVLSLRETEFILAARCLGTRHSRIIGRHILPNVLGSIVVVATLQVPRMILAEASLSFLGLGVQPPTPAWGSMVAAGRDYLFGYWWVATIPGIAISLTVLAINQVGDTLRDLLDPTLR
ncbi:ABC transporter permease [Chloroflexota bacterium]